MTKFTINAENIKRLSTLSGQSKELISLTKPIFCPNQNELSVNLYSPRVAMTFSVEIQGFESDETDEINYFSMNIEDFNTTLATVSNAGENEVNLEINKADNKAIFKSPKTGTKIERTIFNVVTTIDEVKASITAVDDMRTQYLSSPVVLTVTNEVSDFFESAAKFMSLLKTQNTIVLDHDYAKYADQLIVLKKHLSKSVCDKPLYLKKQLYDSIKPFLKLSDELTVYMTEDCNIAFFESYDLGYKAALTLEEARWVYPSDEDLNAVLPADNRKVVVKTTKTALKSAFIPFNNTFKSSGDNWNWKATSLNASEANVNSGKLVLSYSDYTGSAESIIPIELGLNTEGSNGGNLVISIQVIEELLNLIKEEDLTFTFNSAEPSEINGAGVLFESDTITAVCTKFRKPQN